MQTYKIEVTEEEIKIILMALETVFKAGVSGSRQEISYLIKLVDDISSKCFNATNRTTENTGK